MPIRLLSVAFVLCAAPVWAQSYYTTRLDDAKAVHADAMGARGDGLADDTAAIQAAIDRAQDTTGHGIVFVRESRYRITRTLSVWPTQILFGGPDGRTLFITARSSLYSVRTRTPGRRVVRGIRSGSEPM